MSANEPTGGLRTILTAMIANATVACAKFAGFAITGSSALLAEALHSVADTTNQSLLLVGKKKAKKSPSRARPFGHGRERFFWSFVVSLVVFTLGSLYAIYEGVNKIINPEPIDSLVWALAILGFAMCMEGFAFRTAMKEAKHYKGKFSWKEYIGRSKNPEIPVILLEDFGAITGLSFAFICVLLAEVTGNAVWDGVGTLGIGILIGSIAFVLARETKSLLIGEGALPEQVRAIRRAIISHSDVVSIVDLRTEYIGPETLLVAGDIEFSSDINYEELHETVDEIESRIKEVEPLAKLIYLEPDFKN